MQLGNRQGHSRNGEANVTGVRFQLRPLSRKQKSRIFYFFWKCSSDCGRSSLIWFLWSIIIAGFFSWVYSYHLGGSQGWFTKDLKLFDAVYFSVITFTTLGFGDVTPNLGNPIAQGWVMAEVVLGYIMLGGLLAIFTNKIARRA